MKFSKALYLPFIIVFASTIVSCKTLFNKKPSQNETKIIDLVFPITPSYKVVPAKLNGKLLHTDIALESKRKKLLSISV